MLKDLSRSLVGRLVSLGIFALGFWVLYQGLLRDDNLLLLGLGVVAGSALILGGLYLMATTRRLAARRAAEQDAERESIQDDGQDDGQDEGKENRQDDGPNARQEAETEETKGDTLDGSGKGD